MIEVTVKTLDSQNHPFIVEDDITVKEFKDLISGKVNIPAETQRIIYCGRVLQDAKKLNEYDVNGKVVHLVQRAPPQPHRPSTGSGNSNSSRFQMPSPNQIYLGSMAYSADMMDAQQRIPQLPLSQNLSNSRLNVARKMLRLASFIIRNLENQTSENTTNTNTADSNEESLLLDDPIDTMPVLAAQVYVPAFSNVFEQQQQITSAVSAATNNFRFNIPQAENATSVATNERPPEAINAEEEGASALPTAPEIDAPTPENDSPSTNADNNAPRSNYNDINIGNIGALLNALNNRVHTVRTAEAGTSSTTENNTTSQNTSQNNGGGNIARTTSLADLMDELTRIQTRLQPFMARYNELMRNDPTFESETEMRAAQQVFDRVSATMHALGHAYHALSDVLCPFNTPTPRALLCRPTLVQHAVLQAGISLPVRVQTQVDVENITGRNPFARPDSGNSDEGSDESDTAGNAENNQSIPQDDVANEESTGTTENSTAAAGSEATATAQTQEISRPTTTTSSSTRPQVTVTHRPGGGRNVDIIVAMSPDDDPMAQGLGGPNQDLIQSLVHAVTNSVMRSVSLTGVPVSMSTSSVSIPIGNNGAPQFLSGGIRQPNSVSLASPANMHGGSTPPASTAALASTASAESTSTAANGVGAAGQNSQARGNTATLPTTSTQTPRSTPRPHVHLSPHSFRAFDPFLQCNSHHITGQTRNTSRTGNGTRHPNIVTEESIEIMSVQSIPTRARSTSLPRELNRMHSGRNSRSNATASATSASSSSTTPLTVSSSKKNTTNTESTQTSSNVPTEPFMTLPRPVNMEVDTFYDAPEHEDGNESTDARRTKQKVLLPATNGESSSPPLPDVNIGSESWHNNVPSEWVSVVTRDVQVQRHEAVQPPYSDAYLSSVPAKRRKVISCNKPQGTLPQVITESLRQAVLTTGLSQVAPVDLVAGAAGGDTSLQTAYREELRQSIRSRPPHASPPGIAPLKRFPNASICFQKP